MHCIKVIPQQQQQLLRRLRVRRRSLGTEFDIIDKVRVVDIEVEGSVLRFMLQERWKTRGGLSFRFVIANKRRPRPA